MGESSSPSCILSQPSRGAADGADMKTSARLVVMGTIGWVLVACSSSDDRSIAEVSLHSLPHHYCAGSRECAKLDVSACGTAKGCSIGQHCTGHVEPCRSHAQADCSAFAGCYVDTDGLGACIGNEEYCEELDND